MMTRPRLSGAKPDSIKACVPMVRSAERGVRSAELAQTPGLGFGQRESELFEKGFDQMVVARARQTFRIRKEVFAPPLDRHLQFEEFVQGQPLARDFRIGHFFRKMEQVDRIGAPRKVWNCALRRPGPG